MTGLTAIKQIQEDVSLHKVHIIPSSMSTLQRKQNLHPTQQVSISNEEIFTTLWPRVQRECAISFSHDALAIQEHVAMM